MEQDQPCGAVVAAAAAAAGVVVVVDVDVMALARACHYGSSSFAFDFCELQAPAHRR